MYSSYFSNIKITRFPIILINPVSFFFGPGSHFQHFQFLVAYVPGVGEPYKAIVKIVIKISEEIVLWNVCAYPPVERVQNVIHRQLECAAFSKLFLNPCIEIAHWKVTRSSLQGCRLVVG